MWHVEIRSTVRRSGPPRLVPHDQVHLHTGFRSIVAYDEITALTILQNGGTQGLRDIPVRADTLFMDFDNVEPTAFRAWLRASGIGYEEWDSANRSVHFHIPLEPIYGSWVPAAMKAWVKQHAPDADTSFYHAAGMYRLPGTFHHRNPGKCKSLVERVEGSKLVLTAPPPRIRAFSMPEESKSTEDFFSMLTQGQGTGGRSQFAWRLAMTAAEAGIEFNEALKHVEWWNERFASPPLDDAMILRQCESAYKRIANR